MAYLLEESSHLTTESIQGTFLFSNLKQKSPNKSFRFCLSKSELELPEDMRKQSRDHMDVTLRLVSSQNDENGERVMDLVSSVRIGVTLNYSL